MWTKSENADLIKPLSTEIGRNRVIVRRNFQEIPAAEDMPAHYEWEEWQMTAEQFEVYQEAQRNADIIEYIAMMTDVEIPTEEDDFDEQEI